LGRTDRRTGGADGPAYRRLLAPLVERWATLLDEILQPVLHVPRAPLLLARFGLRALAPATLLGRGLFGTDEARALWAGVAAHANLPLSAPASSAFGLVLNAVGHAVGWPFPKGGAGALTQALADYLRDLGGTIETGAPVDDVAALPGARAVLLNLTPRQVLRVAGHQLPRRYARRLERYRYGAGAFKVDYALSDPIPWRAEACRRAGTVHVGGTLDDVAASEQAVADGRVPDRPYVLLAQHSRFDSTRAPADQHTAWAYCHVPNGSPVDATNRIERQIERFAPGFRDTIRDRHVMGPQALEAWNPNLVGGDINGGALDLQQVVARPVLRWTPYRLPAQTPSLDPLSPSGPDPERRPALPVVLLDAPGRRCARHVRRPRSAGGPGGGGVRGSTATGRTGGVGRGRVGVILAARSARNCVADRWSPEATPVRGDPVPAPPHFHPKTHEHPPALRR